MTNPELVEIASGWAAMAQRWAVFGVTQEEAIQKFHQAEEKHKEIDSRIHTDAQDTLPSQVDDAGEEA